MLCLSHIVDLTKFSTTALVLKVMSNKDDAMESLNNFIKGLKLFIEESIKIQDLVLKSRMDENADGHHSGFQEGGVPAHNRKMKQGLCRESLLCFWKKQNRPPSLPNSNPLDYLVFGVCHLHLNETPHNILALLCKRSRS
jgi:hypothetical protein